MARHTRDFTDNPNIIPSNGDRKENIPRRNVSFARLKLAEWRTTLSYYFGLINSLNLKKV